MIKSRKQAGKIVSLYGFTLWECVLCLPMVQLTINYTTLIINQTNSYSIASSWSSSNFTEQLSIRLDLNRLESIDAQSTFSLYLNITVPDSCSIFNRSTCHPHRRPDPTQKNNSYWLKSSPPIEFNLYLPMWILEVNLDAIITNHILWHYFQNCTLTPFYQDRKIWPNPETFWLIL